MKRKKEFTFLLLLVFLALFFIQVNAATVTDLQNQDASALVKLKVLSGYPDGSLKLQNNIKRSEFFTLVVRMMGYDNGQDTSQTAMNFKDLSKTHWAYNYLKIALKYKLISGYPDNTIGTEKNVTFAEALSVLIRALGYENTMTGKWPDNVTNKASELGISKSVSLTADKQLTRGDISVLVYNSLTIPFHK